MRGSKNAKAFELRTATRVSKLLSQSGDSDRSRNSLKEIYDWFTEGFDTKDLKDAERAARTLK